MDLLGQSALIVSVMSFGLGFSVLARNVRNKLYLSFSVLTTTISAWALFFFLAKLWGRDPYYPIHLVLNLWLAPAALGFIRILVRLKDRSSWRLFVLSLILAFGFSIAIIMGWNRENLVLQSIYFVPALVVLQTLQLLWIDYRIKRGQIRPAKPPTVGLARRSLVYFGAVLVLLSCVMDHVPFLGNTIPVLGNLALTTYLFFIGQAITQQRFLNFWALFSRFLVLLAIALTLTGIYSLLFAFIADKPALFLLNSFIISFLIVMLLEPIRQLVRYLTQRLLTQRQRRLELMIREAQRRLTGIVDTSSLFDEVERTCLQGLRPQMISLYLLQGDGTRFRVFRNKIYNEELERSRSIRRPDELIATHPLIEESERLGNLGRHSFLLDQDLQNEVDRSASRNERNRLSALIEALHALGGNLLIPLQFNDRTHGFVLLEVLAPPEPWGNNWGMLPLMAPYFELAARTLQGLEVYSRSREKERLAALGQMAAGLAHEIRNPLGAIKGAAQHLDVEDSRPEAKFLKVIVDEVDRLNRVVTQFLEYSRAPVIERERVDVVVLVEKTIDFLRPILPPGTKISIEATSANSYFLGSAEQVRQVLLNLIQNSFKAVADRSDPQVRLLIRRRDTGEIAISVEDNGVGIRPENIEKLFIPFFTTHPSGTGLGLSISQKIVEAHGGRVEVESEWGRFARFTVVFPGAIVRA